jgi:transposase-like protein
MAVDGADLSTGNPTTVLERAMQAELTHHLGDDKHSPSGWA